MNKDFLWGAALSNVQAEGGYLEDGKGLNVYDTLEISFETGQSTLSDTTVAADHYHHYKEWHSFHRQNNKEIYYYIPFA